MVLYSRYDLGEAMRFKNHLMFRLNNSRSDADETKCDKNEDTKGSVVIGVIVIPVLYSYFYLGAFWDPYSRLDTLPVAVVNNDAGATINGEDRNVGEELCKELADSNELKFVFTDEADAKKGTEGNDYYAMILIPENFFKEYLISGNR